MLKDYTIDELIAALMTKCGLGAVISSIEPVSGKLSSIRWKEKEIAFVQRKTGTENIIPLPAEVGNAIAEYILNGRPKSDSRNIRLQFACGMRPQEVRGLKCVDFNFRRNTVYISESKKNKDRNAGKMPETAYPDIHARLMISAMPMHRGC